MSIKIKLNIPNKIILWCIAIELYNLDQEYYTSKKMGVKQVYQKLKKYLKDQTKLNYISYKEIKVVRIPFTIKIPNSPIKKTYKISFKVKEIKNEKS